MTYYLHTWNAGQTLYEDNGDDGWKHLASESGGEWLLVPNDHTRQMIYNKERETRPVSKEEAAMILFQCKEQA